MAQPTVSWWTPDNTTQVLQWDVGTVDAGSVSPAFGVLVWNNRSVGDADVSDMTNTTISTRDNAGGTSGELVTNTWIEVKVNSLSETTFTPIGGNVTRPIKADDPNIGAGIIKGTANDGTKANARANFCELTLRANVPNNATAGLVNFLTRVSYQYT